jgi:tRNA dimethylallyltransferase
MLEAGFLAEVAGLRDRGDLDLSLPALRAVGYRQAWEHLDGCVDADGMRRRTLAATRQLAKRQLTWLRGWPWMKRLTWGEPAQLAAEIEHQLT